MSYPLSTALGLTTGSSIVAAILAAALGAVFAAADSAIGALPATRIAALLEQDEVEHRPTLERIRERGEAMQATYLAGRLIASAVVTVVLAPPILSRVSGPAGIALIVLGSAILLAPAFVVASAIGRDGADDAARYVRWLRPLELLLTPLAWPLERITLALARRAEEDDTPVTENDKRLAEAEVEAMVDQVEAEGLVGAEPAEMIRNVLEFADLRARDVMIPRSKVEAIERATPLVEVRRMVAESGHSRYPVFDRQLDNLVGLLVAKDVFKAEADEAAGLPAKKLSDLVRTPVNFVHESQSLLSLLREMRSKRQHMAIVVDEFGGVSGVVTLEDVLEEIVGDIRDEHDEIEPSAIRDLGDGRILAEADVALDDLSEFLGTELPEDGRFVSLGGLLMHETGGVPEVGQALEKYGYRFIVRRADDTRLETVEIVRLAPSEAPPPRSGSGVEGGPPESKRPTSRREITSSSSAS
jgi:CBS domain containing-hemolysin-like protein